MADYILLWFKCTHPSQTSPESPLFCPEISRPVRTINKWLVNKLNYLTVSQHSTLGVLISPCLSKLGQNLKKKDGFSEKNFQPAFCYSAVNYKGIRQKKKGMLHKITCVFFLWEVKFQVSPLTLKKKQNKTKQKNPFSFHINITCLWPDLVVERAVMEPEGRRLPGGANL